MKKITVHTAQILMEIIANKCVNCSYSNSCIQLRRENCVKEVLNEQIKIV